MEAPDSDRQIRWLVYRHFIETGSPPNTPMLARESGSDLHSVEASLRRLAEAHSLVLVPAKQFWDDIGFT